MLTLELRWFLERAQPLSEAELDRFGEGRRIESRVDLYQLGTGEGIGRKRRGRASHVELKQRRSDHHHVVALPSAPELALALEYWEKSWPPSESEGVWLEVEKRRSVLDLARCRAELTALHLPISPSGPQYFASLAVETLPRSGDLDGRDSAAEARLVDAFVELATCEAPVVRAFVERGVHAGYPAWIHRMTHDDDA